MNANIIDCIQGDATWLQCRIGCVTSSRVAAAISELKRKSGEKQPGDETAAREHLRFELMREIMREQASDHYVSRWMEEGKEKEPLARAAYEFEKGVEARQIGFAYHPTIKMAGCSPDALVGNDGGAEFKCPKTETHLRYLTAGVVPPEYRPQCYWQIDCMDWEWCDFMSHDPDMKKRQHRSLIVRLHRDEKIQADMRSKVIRFNDEVQEAIAKLDPDYITDRLRESIAQAKARKNGGPQLIVSAMDEELMIGEEDCR